MADRVIFVLTLCLAALYFYATAQIPTLDLGDPLGPKAFPRLLGIGLLITAAVLFMELRRAGKTPSEEAQPRIPRDNPHLLVVAAVVGVNFIYFCMFVPLGFVLATAIYFLVLSAYLNRGK